MKIPEVARGEYQFWERIDNAREVTRLVSGRQIKFFVQPTRADCVHACTIDDLTRLLAHVPPADWEGIEAVLLRQPHRKEDSLAPAWGRLAYVIPFGRQLDREQLQQDNLLTQDFELS